ncbi:MAG: hypothetical protein ACRELA_17750 [Candidatus Rokuibacteriota bacterium]
MKGDVVRAKARLMAAWLGGALLLGVGSGPATADSWRALQALPRVALEVDLAGPPGLAADEVRRRAEAALREHPPAPALDPASPDRLRLTVAVRAHGASELRGFWLPFSGTYGIGPVRLAVQRRVAVPGLPLPVAAVVWQSERQAAGPWRKAAREIGTLLDDLVTAFLADYRRANPP